MLRRTSYLSIFINVSRKRNIKLTRKNHRDSTPNVKAFEQRVLATIIATVKPVYSAQLRDRPNMTV